MRIIKSDFDNPLYKYSAEELEQELREAELKTDYTIPIRDYYEPYEKRRAEMNRKLAMYKRLDGKKIKTPKPIDQERNNMQLRENPIYAEKKAFAIRLGFEYIADAMGKYGRRGFEQKFNEYKKNKI